MRGIRTKKDPGYNSDLCWLLLLETVEMYDGLLFRSVPVGICWTDVSQSQSAKTSQSLRNENDLKPTPHDLENIFDTDEEIEGGDSVTVFFWYCQSIGYHYDSSYDVTNFDFRLTPAHLNSTEWWSDYSSKVKWSRMMVESRSIWSEQQSSRNRVLVVTTT